jgi:hypothetical protein
MHAALLAFVNDNKVPCASLDGHRLHESTAFGTTIAGIFIHVFAIQAMRAVVGISVAVDISPAAFTAEVFNSLLELLSR